MDEPDGMGVVRRHARLIHKIAWAYCRNATDREDVVQEVAVQVWRCRDRFDARFKESTWVYRIALNVAISFHRREGRRRTERLDGEQAVTIVAEDEVEVSEELSALRRCIDELGALERALVLLYLDGNDHATIAEVLGISVSNVGTKLSRVRERLRVEVRAKRGA